MSVRATAENIPCCVWIYVALSAVQVPSLAQALATGTNGRSKGAPSLPPPAGAKQGPNQVATATATAAIAAIRETAAAFDLYCPNGQYSLTLSHPAAKHMFDQIMQLRNSLQQLQQQAKQHQKQQQQQQQMAMAAAAKAAAAAEASGAAVAIASRSRGPSGQSSRSSSPQPKATGPAKDSSNQQASKSCMGYGSC